MDARKTEVAPRCPGPRLLVCIWVCCSGLLLWVPNAYAQSLWQNARIVSDPQGEWSAAQAWEHSMSDDATHLTHAHETVNAKEAQVVWAAWSLPISITLQLPVWLGVHLPACAHAQLWLRSDQGDWKLQALEHEQGQTALWGDGHMLPVWALPPTGEGHTDVLLRIPNTGSMQLPVWLHKPENFMRIQWKYALMHGVLLALLMAVIVYALSLLRFFEKQALLLFTGMLLMQFAAMAWLSGLAQLLFPGLPLSLKLYLEEIAVWLWLALGTLHTRLVICHDHKQAQLNTWLVYWGLACCVVGPAWCLTWPTRAHDIAAGVLLTHVLVLLGCCVWHLKQKITFKSIFHFTVWLMYVLALVFYIRSDKVDLHPEDALLLSNGLSVFASLLMAWTNCWRLMVQRENFQRKLSLEIQRNHWFAVAHHDLWQPLQSVQLYAHALAQAQPEQQPGLLSGMQLATRSVEDFMQQLRSLSDRQQTQAHWLLQRQAVTAHALLSPLITECLPLAHCHHVSLKYRSNRSLLRVNVAAVQRMLRNLINNALTYTPAGGRVLIGCRIKGDRLWILCIDNGKGMTPEQLGLCTQAYTRFEMENTNNANQGLGLYSVKKMAEQMELPLVLQSEAGKGSVFGFAVPLAHALWTQDLV